MRQYISILQIRQWVPDACFSQWICELGSIAINGGQQAEICDMVDAGAGGTAQIEVM